MRHLLLAVSLIVALGAATPSVQAQPAAAAPVAGAERSRVNIDADWRFALGHAYDPSRDFGHGTAPFFFAQAGYGDGPASPKFDDRAWRRLDLPHDWAAEAPFDPKASGNHGSKAVGPGFPESSIGWYRKALAIGPEDLGKRIVVEFDGVYRNATVWFNGHYIGREPSGYSSFAYDLTDYVDYGGRNVLAVRVDASGEEGWFYEGAGIYRHVWLTKTAPLHVARWGTFVTSTVGEGGAGLSIKTKVQNEGPAAEAVSVEHQVVDAEGKTVLASVGPARSIAADAAVDDERRLSLPRPRLWSIKDPYLYRLVTVVRRGGTAVDRYETPFGVREVRWDPDTGFWLNGENIKLKGVNLHQDHAGVGVALSDALEAWRLRRLQTMGVNAVRTAHGPPSPALLDAADRLGVLILDEHRMMGTSPEITDQLTRLVERDRNHPSVILWSVGNEEWALEGNDLGARLTKLMQAKVKALDPSRAATVAISGGAPRGSSSTTEVVGFNYRAQHDVDAYHRLFPKTPAVMTEEGSTFATRGVYVSDPARQHLAAYDQPQRPQGSSSIEQGWRAVVERPWMAGMFVWTGLDYRGETTPFGWPAISSQFGMLDTTGAFKDSAYYLQSWWTDAPMVHVVGHWTWPGRTGQTIPIWVYSNADEVELLLNGRSLGRKAMPRQGHLEWEVAYAPGALVARGFKGGAVVAEDRVSTTGAPKALRLTASPASVGGAWIAPVEVSAVDAKGRRVPTAGDAVAFTVERGGRIVGVGNGDPSSHEPDQFVERRATWPTVGWKMAGVTSSPMAGLPDLADAAWRDPFAWYPPGSEPPLPAAFVVRGAASGLPAGASGQWRVYAPLLTADQRLFVNGEDLTARAVADAQGWSVPFTPAADGRVEVVILVPSNAQAALQALQDRGLNGSNVAFVARVEQPAPWSRSLFNGHAQVLVEAAPGAREVVLTAAAPGLVPARLVLRAGP
jgi:beta-galactosidase